MTSSVVLSAIESRRNGKFKQFAHTFEGKEEVPKMRFSPSPSKYVSIILSKQEFEEDAKTKEQINRKLESWKKSFSMAKLPSVITEPVPSKDHVKCAVCNVLFTDYLSHIRS